MIILAIDPSGNFDSGKGKTGMALADTEKFAETLQLQTVSAKKYNRRYDYWNAIIAVILNTAKNVKAKGLDLHVVLENFVIRNNGFTVGTMPETIRLIGAIENELLRHNISYSFQTPSAVKTRINNTVLLKYVPDLIRDRTYFKLKGKITNDHERDALRHLIYFKKYGGK